MIKNGIHSQTVLHGRAMRSSALCSERKKTDRLEWDEVDRRYAGRRVYTRTIKTCLRERARSYLNEWYRTESS